MNFRTNQVLQFYVNNDKNTVALVDKTADNGTFWFTNTQDGKVVSRTDIIEKGKILYATYATAASMQLPTKKFTVAAPAEVVAGQDYVVKVEFTNYQGMGDMDITVKVGAAHATANTDAKKLMDEIAWTLEKNLKSEYAPLVTVTVDESNNLVIEEALQDEWVLGVTPNEGVNFRVYIAPITVDGEEVYDWTTVTKAAGTEVIKNGRKMADLEYFAMGERGDQYRMVGWPNVIRTKYSVDPEKEYDALTIHYAFVDSNEGVQKSERDLMIVGEAAKLSTFKTFVEGLDIKFIEKA
jgi:hypothetical protein